MRLPDILSVLATLAARLPLPRLSGYSDGQLLLPRYIFQEQ